jgi:hypothetical protein|tara:strand:- start:83 stop:340 length:258 start_codon:yes stop_codon:yes gene_type:complete
MHLICNTKHGAIEWRWKTIGDPSPAYKSLNHQWWIPKKSEFELITKVDLDIKQEVKDEIWEDMQSDFDYTKELYKLHKKIKKDSK